MQWSLWEIQAVAGSGYNILSLMQASQFTARRHLYISCRLVSDDGLHGKSFGKGSPAGHWLYCPFLKNCPFLQSPTMNRMLWWSFWLL